MPSEHELPTDFHQWPSDPRSLFGLDSKASRRDLKRAYTRLIRQFKPEHSPDHFRRLREAFEQLDQQFEWREQFEERYAHLRNADPVSDPDSDPPVKVDNSKILDGKSTIDNIAVPNNDIDQELPRRTGHGARYDNVDHFWQQALDGGDLKIVYSKLKEEAARRTLSETDYARLYWLLTVQPDLETDRDPCNWLFEGLRRHGHKTRLIPILEIDVQRRLGQVPVLLDDDLLDSSFSIGQLVEIVGFRWTAARRLARFELIGADILRLRNRFFLAPDEWRALLCSAVKNLVLVPDHSANEQLQNLREELQNIPEGLDSNWVWDWYEATIRLHNSWADNSQSVLPNEVQTLDFINIFGHSASVPNPSRQDTLATLSRLTKLIKTTWQVSTQHNRNELRSFSADLTKNPESSLNDLIAINQIARRLIIRLLELLHEQNYDSTDTASYEITPGVERALKIFVRRNLWTYNRWETTVLKFCLEEAVTPDDVATALEECHDQLPDNCLEIAALIRNHLPLNCIVEAQRLVWSTQ